MKLHPIQTSFETGELTPRMRGRSETEPYKTGLSSCLNMVVDSRGPLRSRSGTRHIESFAAECARIETLQISRLTYFSMLFTEFLVTITNESGSLPNVELVNNAHFVNSGAGWSENDVGGGSGVSFAPGLAVLTVGGGGNPNKRAEIFQSVAISDGDQPHNITIVTTGGADYNVRIGSAQGLDDYLSDITDVPVYTAQVNPGIPGIITVWIEVRNTTNSTSVAVTTVSLSSDVGTQVSFVTPYMCEDLDALYFIQAPAGGSIYVLHREYAPRKLTYDRLTNIFTLELVDFNDGTTTPPSVQPPEWHDAAPGVEASWPGVGAIFQGRLWLGSTTDNPETFWGSRAGQIENFTVVDPLDVLADDAILGVTMEYYGRIEWMISTKNLVLGTTNGEYIVDGSQGVILPNDIQIRRQSAYGSAPVQPVQINDQIIYVSNDRRKIRAMKFELTANNWVSSDLLFLSEHLTESLIRGMNWAPNPDNLLWLNLFNGTALSCAYERNNQITGWTRHDTQGFIYDFAVGEDLGKSVVNVVVIRQPDIIELEFMNAIQTEEPLDSAVHYFEDPPTDVFAGLDHLEGYEVQILADGAVHPVRTVVGGEVTLQIDATDVVIGLQFDTAFITLPLEMGAATGTGSTQQKRYSSITVRLLDSSNPLINGKRTPNRLPATPMGNVQPSATSDITVANVGWDTEALIAINQDLPLKLTVASIFGVLGQEDL